MSPSPDLQPIPINDPKRLYDAFAVEIEAAVLDTLRSGWWLNGPRNAAFSKSFADFIGATAAILVANGTDAIELALRSLRATGRLRGSEIISVANAGGYTSTACRQVGLTPVYADIEEDSQLISMDSVVAALCEETGAVVATHLYGGVVDILLLRARLDEAGYAHVPILEDCAQAHGARCGNRLAGSMADIATFSFYPTKNLGALGDAGAVVVSDPELAQSVRYLQQYGWTSKYAIGVPGGRNSRIDEVQAAILSAMLPHLGAINEERSLIWQRYRSGLSGLLRFVEAGPGSITHLAVARSDERESLRDFLKEKKIATDIHYPILDCDQPGWAGLPMRVSPTGVDVSRRSIGQIFSLPCFPGLSEAEVDRVVGAVEEWAGR